MIRRRVPPEYEFAGGLEPFEDTCHRLSVEVDPLDFQRRTGGDLVTGQDAFVDEPRHAMTFGDFLGEMLAPARASHPKAELLGFTEAWWRLATRTRTIMTS